MARRVEQTFRCMSFNYKPQTVTVRALFTSTKKHTVRREKKKELQDTNKSKKFTRKETSQKKQPQLSDMKIHHSKNKSKTEIHNHSRMHAAMCRR